MSCRLTDSVKIMPAKSAAGNSRISGVVADMKPTLNFTPSRPDQFRYFQSTQVSQTLLKIVDYFRNATFVAKNWPDEILGQ